MLLLGLLLWLCSYFLKLSCRRRSFHRADKDLVQRGKHLFKGNNIRSLVNKIAQYIIRFLSFIYFYDQLFLVCFDRFKCIAIYNIGDFFKLDAEQVFFKILFYSMHTAI